MARVPALHEECRQAFVDIFDRAVSMMHGLAESSGVRLRVEIEPDFPELRTDGSKLLQVVLNLALNALHATPWGGRVVLRVRPAARAGACIEVVDTGTGVPSEDLERIFTWQEDRKALEEPDPPLQAGDLPRRARARDASPRGRAMPRA